MTLITTITNNTNYLNNLYTNPKSYLGSNSVQKEIQTTLNQFVNFLSAATSEMVKSAKDTRYENVQYTINTKSYTLTFNGDISENGSHITSGEIKNKKSNADVGFNGDLSFAGLPFRSALNSATFDQFNYDYDYKTSSSSKTSSYSTNFVWGDFQLNPKTQALTGSINSMSINRFLYTANKGQQLSSSYSFSSSISANFSQPNSAAVNDGPIDTIIIFKAIDGGVPDEFFAYTHPDWRLSTPAANLALHSASGDNISKNGPLGSVIAGGTGADTIIADHGANTISAGLGNDTITGGDGNNVIVFNTAPGPYNVDTLTDFNQGDHLQFSRKIFKGLSSKLSAADFLSTTEEPIATAKQHLIFDTTNHTLYYNPDGSGIQEAVAVAIIGNSYNLSFNDLSVTS